MSLGQGHKQVVMRRLGAASPSRPMMLAIAGDSAAGKTTLTRGLVKALGQTVSSMCVDDYHRYDREERERNGLTPLHPECNYMAIMEQHLQLVAMGEPILKPVYNHERGTLERPELFVPAETVVVEGLLPLHSRMSRACFDLSVYLDLPEEVRRAWKVRRDTRDRGYTEGQVLAELDRREADSAAFIRPQRRWADVVVRFAPIDGREHREGEGLSATILLRPTAPHPDLCTVLNEDTAEAIHLKLVRDHDGKPVDALHVHAHAPREKIARVEQAIWRNLGTEEELPETLGLVEPGLRSEPLAVLQLILLYHIALAHRLHGDSDGRAGAVRRSEEDAPAPAG